MHRYGAALVLGLGSSMYASSALGADSSIDPETRQMTREEIEAWLDASAVESERDVGVVEAMPEAPPPPPRRHGLVVEGGIGAAGHLSTLKNISPTSPEFNLAVGYEVLDPLLLFLDATLLMSSTRYAKQPPDTRTYAYYGFGGGARFTFEIGESFGVYLQGNAGMAAATEDVLVVYGYTEADQLNLYYGGQLGFEWFQVNPHYALAAHAGVKNYMGLEREASNEPPLVVSGGLAIKYTF